MSKLTVSMLVVLVAVATFTAMPQTASSVSIDRLTLVGESQAVAEGTTCPVKSNHNCCQQSVNTGAFGTVPAPVLAEGTTCPVKSNHNSCQQSVNTGAFGICPAPIAAL